MDLATNLHRLHLRSSFFTHLRPFSTPKPFSNPSSSVPFTRKQRCNITSQASVATATVEKESLADTQNDIESAENEGPWKTGSRFRHWHRLGCGVGFGLGVVEGVGIGPGFPGLQFGFGLGVGCGVGMGFGYGVGKGVVHDENRKYSNVGELFHGPGYLSSQDEIGTIVDELVLNMKKVMRATSERMTSGEDELRLMGFFSWTDKSFNYPFSLGRIMAESKKNHIAIDIESVASLKWSGC